MARFLRAIIGSDGGKAFELIVIVALAAVPTVAAIQGIEARLGANPGTALTGQR